MKKKFILVIGLILVVGIFIYIGISTTNINEKTYKHLVEVYLTPKDTGVITYNDIFEGFKVSVSLVKLKDTYHTMYPDLTSRISQYLLFLNLGHAVQVELYNPYFTTHYYFNPFTKKLIAVSTKPN